MIEPILEWSLKNRFLVLALWAIVAVGGVWAMVTLPIDAVPDVTNVQVQVLTSAPALGPEEVERFVTTPVELAMSGLPRLAEVRSISRFGLVGGDRGVRGRHGHLLRPPARERAAAGRARRHPRGLRRARAGPGLDRPGRDLPVRGARPGQEPDGAAHDPGVGDRTAPAPRSRAWWRSTPSAASSRPTRCSSSRRAWSATTSPSADVFTRPRTQQRQRGRRLHREEPRAVPDPRRRADRDHSTTSPTPW